MGFNSEFKGLKHSGNHTALFLPFPLRYHKPRTYEVVQTPHIHPTRILLLAICSHASSQDGEDLKMKQNINYIYKS